MKPIVAVFGGSSYDAWAVERSREVGACLAARQVIVLTGAGAGDGDDSVKGAAIAGVGTSAWIGVDRSKSPKAVRCGSGFVLSPAINHKRNYVEACICQAAICLPGGHGTRSEATCALALQRPVAFWGDEWEALADELRENPSAATADLARSTVSVFRDSPSGGEEIDKGCSNIALQSSLETLPPHRFFRTEESAESVAA